MSSEKNNLAEKKTTQEEANSRRRLFAAVPLALGGLLAACGQTTFTGANKTKKVTIVKKKADDAAVEIEPEVTEEVAAAPAAEPTQLPAEIPTQEPTAEPTADSDDAVAAVQPTAVPTVHPLAMLNKVDLSMTEQKALQTMFPMHAIYGKLSSALLTLTTDGVKAGDTILVTRPDPGGKNHIIASRKVTEHDLETSIVFDNLNFGSAEELELALFSFDGCKSVKTRLPLNNFMNTYKQGQVFDAQSYINSATPDVGFYNAMPNIEYTHPLGSGDKAPVAFGKQRNSNRPYRVATSKSEWSISFVAMGAGISQSKYEYCDAFGRSVNPADPKFLQKNNLLVVYYPASENKYYRYFFFFG